jgi:hypothetical protein
MRFRHSLPPIEAAFSHPPPFSFHFFSSRDNSSSSRMTQNASLHTLSFAHLIAMGATITLHGLVGSETTSYREIALHAAKDMAKLLSSLDNIGDSILHSSTGVKIFERAGTFPPCRINRLRLRRTDCYHYGDSYSPRRHVCSTGG